MNRTLQANGLQQCFGIARDIRRVGVRAIPFKHGEFRTVARAAFAVTKARADLEDAIHSSGQQLLHLQFRAGAQELPAARWTIYVRLRGWSGDADISLHLHKTPSIEKGADSRQERRPGAQIFNRAFRIRLSAPS